MSELNPKIGTRVKVIDGRHKDKTGTITGFKHCEYQGGLGCCGKCSGEVIIRLDGSGINYITDCFVHSEDERCFQVIDELKRIKPVKIEGDLYG